MKKILILFILPAVLVILSLFCFYISKKYIKKNYRPAAIITSFDSTAKINSDGKLYECIIRHTSEQMNTLEITQPKDLDGLMFIWEGGKCMVVWKNLTCEINKEFLPQNAFAETIINILNLISDENNLNFESGNFEKSIFSGKAHCCNFKVTIDKAGEIKTISVPDIKLEVEMVSSK